MTSGADGEETVWVISNEFAFVHVSKVRVGNGERLRVTSPGRNSSVLLDPVVLEAISTANPEDLGAFVTRELDQ